MALIAQANSETYVIISDDSGSYFLYRFDREGNAWDTWHPSVEEALEQSAYDLGYSLDWKEIDEEGEAALDIGRSSQQAVSQPKDYSQELESFLVSRYPHLFAVHASSTLDYLVAQWRGLARETSAGYSFGIEDYTNDVSTRTIIENIAQNVPGMVSEIQMRVAEVDSKFRELTRESKRPIIKATGASYWWESRVPIKCFGELAEDLATIED